MCLTHSLNIRYKKVLSVSVCALVSLLLLYLRFEVVYNKEFLLAHTASNTRRTHVALLIGGAARSMGLPIVHNSLKRFVIDALQQNRSIQIDVILRLSLRDASSWGHSSKFPQVTHKFLRSALDTLQPVSLSFYESKPHNINSRDPFNRNCQDDAEKYHLPDATFAHLEVSKALLEQARSFENDTNTSYEWFIRTRPDYVWFAPLNIPMLNAERTDTLIFDESWPWPISDAFYIVHHSLADGMWFKGAILYREIPCSVTQGHGILNPEGMLASVADWLNATTVPLGVSNESTFARHDGLECPRSSSSTISDGGTHKCNVMNNIYRHELGQWASTN